VNTMEKRLTLELRGRQSHKVKELDLDGVKCGGEIDFGDYDFSSLVQLTISDAGLTSLKNFPTLPNLERLDLCKNRISKGLESITECKNLRTLMLTNNRLKPTPDLEVLTPLTSLPHLTHLDLGENFVPEENPERMEARLRIFKKLPNLQYLDGEDINEKADEDDDEDEDDDDDDDEEEDEDEEDVVNGLVNGLGGDDGLGDDELDEDDELEEEEEAESDEDDLEEEGRSHLNNGDLNGAYNEDSDAEDEDEDEESSHHSGGKTGGKTGAGRGKKRKFEDDNP